MGGGDDDIALHRGADHGSEFFQQVALVLRAQGNRHLDARGEQGAVAQQEEQQVEHDGETDQKVGRVLAEAKRLARHGLTILRHAPGKRIAQAGNIADAQPVHHLHHP